MRRDIREVFIEYFKCSGHNVVPSVKLPIEDDPSLMFVNSGMVPFKPIFLGIKKAEHKRVTNVQRCLRISGKHNDLESVGYDGYHHTFFEMLGNWSFNDYFKEEAIAFAWNFLTKELSIPQDRLYATYFAGEPSLGLPPDTETQEIWRKFLPSDRILPFGYNENFWEMGDSGPCGPSTEIHIDLKTKNDSNSAPAQTLINTGNPNVIELWNIVFIQYNKTGTNLVKLPEKFVDTGMGLERLLRCLEKASSNYTTSLFAPIIETIENILGVNYQDTSSPIDTAIRIIADHIRAIYGCIQDKVLPSNIGAGYVVRRLIRRALLFSYMNLNVKRPILYKVIPAVAKTLVFHYKQENLSNLQEIIKKEEENFLNTLEKGTSILNKIIEKEKKISGKDAFELYDTHGFPLELTILFAKEHNASVDVEGFNKYMQEQKERARLHSRFISTDWYIINKSTQKFVGYDCTTIKTKIIQKREVVTGGKTYYHYVLEENPFYAEAGGQVGDKGYLSTTNEKVNVIDTQREHNIEYVICENPLSEEICVAEVDLNLRYMASIHHTATHLFHYALRKIFSFNGSLQRGSYVHPDYLRFDFPASNPLSPSLISEIEEIVQEEILKKYSKEEFRSIPFEEAIKMGAITLPGEKYSNTVRVIKFGSSIELCGGTHVNNTMELLSFVIIKEEGIAAGVRRIIAKSGKAAISLLKSKSKTLNEIEKILKNPPDTLTAIQKKIQKINELQKLIEKLSTKVINYYALEIQNMNGSIISSSSVYPFQFKEKEIDLPQEFIRALAFTLKKAAPKDAFLLTSHEKNGAIVFPEFFNATLCKKLWEDFLRSNPQLRIKGGVNQSILFFTYEHTNDLYKIKKEIMNWLKTSQENTG